MRQNFVNFTKRLARGESIFDFLVEGKTVGELLANDYYIDTACQTEANIKWVEDPSMLVMWFDNSFVNKSLDYTMRLQDMGV
jgi:hypothetical protein